MIIIALKVVHHIPMNRSLMDTVMNISSLITTTTTTNMTNIITMPLVHMITIIVFMILIQKQE